jgi:hypothetical protein
VTSAQDALQGPSRASDLDVLPAIPHARGLLRRRGGQRQKKGLRLDVSAGTKNPAKEGRGDALNDQYPCFGMQPAVLPCGQAPLVNASTLKRP